MNKSLLSRALDAWYRREQPMDPRNRCKRVAEEYGVSESLLWKYAQLDFSRRAEAY